MNCGISIVLVLCNIAALILFLTAWGLITTLVSANAPLRVTELDRRGVINETKLQQSYPELAANLRYNLGMWIAESERIAAQRVAAIGAAAAIVNLLVLALGRLPLLQREKRRAP